MTNAAGRSTAAVGSAAISSGFMKTNPENGGEVQREDAEQSDPARGVEQRQAVGGGCGRGGDGHGRG